MAKFNYKTLKNTLKTEYDGFVNEGELLAKISNLLTDDELDAYIDGLYDNFNMIVLQNGEAYIVSKNLQALKNFIKSTEINSNDNVWNMAVELKNGKKRQLKNI